MNELTDNATLDGLAEAGRLSDLMALMIIPLLAAGSALNAKEWMPLRGLLCRAHLKSCISYAHDIIEMAKQEQNTLRDQFIESRRQVKKLGEVAERNVERQELFRDRELQSILDGSSLV